MEYYETPTKGFNMLEFAIFLCVLFTGAGLGMFGLFGVVFYCIKRDEKKAELEKQAHSAAAMFDISVEEARERMKK